MAKTRWHLSLACSAGLAMQVALPARSWKTSRDGCWWRAGKQMTRLRRQKSIGNEAALVWLPMGQVASWFTLFFFPFLCWILLKIIFLPMMLSRKSLQGSLQNFWQYCLYVERRGTEDKIFLMLCFNLTDALLVNYEPNSQFHRSYNWVDTLIFNPTFPFHERLTEPRDLHIYLLLTTSLTDLSGRAHVGWRLSTDICLIQTSV